MAFVLDGLPSALASQLMSGTTQTPILLIITLDLIHSRSTDPRTQRAARTCVQTVRLASLASRISHLHYRHNGLLGTRHNGLLQHALTTLLARDAGAYLRPGAGGWAGLRHSGTSCNWFGPFATRHLGFIFMQRGVCTFQR